MKNKIYFVKVYYFRKYKCFPCELKKYLGKRNEYLITVFNWFKSVSPEVSTLIKIVFFESRIF